MNEKLATRDGSAGAVDPADARLVPYEPEGLGEGIPTDTRSWLAAADGLGELRVLEGVDAEESIGLICEMLHHTEDSPAVLFDDIPGYPKGWRVLVNSFGSRSRLAMTLGLDPKIGTFELTEDWERKLNEVEPKPVTYVEDGPIMANVARGEDVDILSFPTPMWHPEDGGRYIGTGDGVLTRDPDSDWVNMGAYRVMIHDRNHTGLYISPGKHGWIHRNKHFEKDEPLPAVVLVGLSPLQFIASGLEIPNGVSELEWVGGMLGESVRCIKGEATGLPIPVEAEIALEGFLHPDQMRLEGPFGEWTGYYASASREEPVFEVTNVYHRDDPILLGCPPEKPPYEAQRFQQYLRSANLRRELTAAGVPDVTGVWTHSVGGCRLFNVVSIKQRYAGHAKQAGRVATHCRQGNYLGRIVVVVDDDIDITDLHEVIWAVVTRADPAGDMDILTGALSGPLDPAIHPDHKGRNSRLIIDATRPWDWRDQFPEAIGPTPEIKHKTRRDYGWIMDGVR